MNELVSTNWLYKNIELENLVIFDCSWYMPKDKNNAYKDYSKGHIINSYFFDIDKISDSKSKLPHMIPSKDSFIKKIRNFNIHKNTKIITYSTNNIMGPSRVWWMFKYFGFKNISVLNGGLNKWLREKKTIVSKKTKYIKSSFNFQENENFLTKKKDIINNYLNKDFLIFDARNKNRFKGIDKEPRKYLKSGHIPKSKNIFWKDLTKDGTILKKNLIKKKFSKYKLDNKKIILSCGSGISACVLSLSLKYALGIKSSVYDGSWTEWGSSKKLSIEK